MVLEPMRAWIERIHQLTCRERISSFEAGERGEVQTMIFSAYIEELRKIYARHDLSLRLAAGNAEKTLVEAEAKLDFSLEPGLREAWRMANGSRREMPPVFAKPDFFTGYDFLSLDAAIKARAGMKRRAPQYAGYVEPEPRNKRIRPGWFHSGWVPFADFGGGTLLLIQDYSPSETGRAGQIIAYTHDPDEIDYVAPDFQTFLQLSLKSIKEDPEEFLEAFLED